MIESAAIPIRPGPFLEIGLHLQYILFLLRPDFLVSSKAICTTSGRGGISLIARSEKWLANREERDPPPPSVQVYEGMSYQFGLGQSVGANRVRVIFYQLKASPSLFSGMARSPIFFDQFQGSRLVTWKKVQLSL